MANGTTKLKKEEPKLKQVAKKEETVEIKVVFEGPGKYKLSDESKQRLERIAKRYYDTGKMPSLSLEKEGVNSIVFSKWEEDKKVIIKVN